MRNQLAQIGKNCLKSRREIVWNSGQFCLLDNSKFEFILIFALKIIFSGQIIMQFLLPCYRNYIWLFPRPAKIGVPKKFCYDPRTAKSLFFNLFQICISVKKTWAKIFYIPNVVWCPTSDAILLKIFGKRPILPFSKTASQRNLIGSSFETDCIIFCITFYVLVV